MSVRLEHGDMREVLARIPDRFHAVVTDPPYHLASIVKRFSKSNPADVEKNATDRKIAGQGTSPHGRAARGFMGKEWDGGDIAFQPETWALVGSVMVPGAHLVAFAGTKGSHRMACAIEDAGFEIRDTLAWLYGSGFPKSHNQKGDWDGWGTALKPAYEPVVLARWPMAGKTVAANLAEHSCGALNVTACRIGTDGGTAGAGAGAIVFSDGLNGKRGEPVPGLGRWPANVVHDGSEEVLAAFPDRDGATSNGKSGTLGIAHEGYRAMLQAPSFADSGSAARFFYSAKADAADRLQSKHPTVKPVDLMRWLVRLVTPPGGLVLDPFAGSGTTGMACMAEGVDCVLIEREAEYVADIRRRIAHVDGSDAPLFAEART